jgi:hypothetical protein
VFRVHDLVQVRGLHDVRHQLDPFGAGGARGCARRVNRIQPIASKSNPTRKVIPPMA